MSNMKKSNIIFFVGMVILLIGAGLSIAGLETWADYVLIAGALVTVSSGFVRMHGDTPSGHSRFAEKIAEKMFPNKDEESANKKEE